MLLFFRKDDVGFLNGLIMRVVGLGWRPASPERDAGYDSEKKVLVALSGRVMWVVGLGCRPASPKSDAGYEYIEYTLKKLAGGGG